MLGALQPAEAAPVTTCKSSKTKVSLPLCLCIESFRSVQCRGGVVDCASGPVGRFVGRGRIITTGDSGYIGRLAFQCPQRLWKRIGLASRVLFTRRFCFIHCIYSLTTFGRGPGTRYPAVVLGNSGKRSSLVMIGLKPVPYTARCYPLHRLALRSFHKAFQPNARRSK